MEILSPCHWDDLSWCKQVQQKIQHSVALSVGMRGDGAQQTADTALNIRAHWHKWENMLCAVNVYVHPIALYAVYC